MTPGEFSMREGFIRQTVETMLRDNDEKPRPGESYTEFRQRIVRIANECADAMLAAAKRATGEKHDPR